MDEIINNNNACQVLLQLLSPNNKKYISNENIELLKISYLPQENEETKTVEMIPTSKKDDDIRRNEILSFIEPTIVNSIINKMDVILSNEDNDLTIPLSIYVILEELKRNWNMEIIKKLCEVISNNCEVLKENGGRLCNLILKEKPSKEIKDLLVKTIKEKYILYILFCIVMMQ